MVYSRGIYMIHLASFFPNELWAHLSSLDKLSHSFPFEPHLPFSVNWNCNWDLYYIDKVIL